MLTRNERKKRFEIMQRQGGRMKIGKRIEIGVVKQCV